ncbi:2-oxoglutarate dehydrogenase complex dihydrolipoyllysine-residue succinyltransferase [Sphingomicrobium aestuariivivum]|uniref:2-oxoglutarate dehydrogenase complex dihydrolipoyllysine-residue succinyltransferase n=1 Tax=Sphingomicrobium aestuariivivum TaxID=1582356 RepID=UPI001FD6F88A|nr:2-oxoglutarate dehydrogenase complex dihydrolipoyllysine-residue succinyltransferase [Sphingomicrobium aestuariivivum]MCJ8190617.1 2-oxoglutarate dehydrogenase complex dihydrolipoyllysine-residue succinyltransferase [Sphingomicrobium aestuariivivum]
MATDVTVPTLGESITEATVGEWLKQPGEPVEQDEPIVSLETDKVSVDVPSPVAGVLEEHLFSAGDTVEVGQVIAKVGDGNGAVADAPKPARTEQAASEGPDGVTENNDVIAQDKAGEQALSSDLTLSPAVRRAVLEHGVDPSKITGTGKDGRITKDDVIAAAKDKSAEPATKAAAASGGQASAPTSVSVSGERREERVKMSRLRQTIAKRLKDAQNTAALLTTFNDVDMSAVMEARSKYKDHFAKKHGIRLGFMSFFVKAVALAAKDVPAVNARIEGDEIVYHDYLDVSVAVSAPKGLVVPVIRSADKMSFAQIEQAIADYGKRAKEGTLGMEDMAGGTFTISNGGVFGSLLSTPIINPPQSAVLGMHRIEERPIAVNGEVVIKPMMYLALSYDHRLIDGREAVTFLVRIKEALEDPTRLLIDL